MQQFPHPPQSQVTVADFVVDQFQKAQDAQVVAENVSRLYGEYSVEKVLETYYREAYARKIWTPSEEKSLHAAMKSVDGDFWEAVARQVSSDGRCGLIAG